MTLVVLALDALDPTHVKLSGTETFQLSTWGECETFAYMYDKPHTSEVWPTVATGSHPSDHGVTKNQTSRWDNFIVNFASKFTGQLSGKYRAKLGQIAQQVTGANWELQEVDEPTFLDGDRRAVHNWPGVCRGSELQRAWDVFSRANQHDSDMSKDEFDRRIRGIAAEQFGWLREMLKHDLDLVATHVHVIDAAGHVYQYDRERYYDTYRWAVDRVEGILSAMSSEDDLLIISDHGIETSWVSENPESGAHSWRAFSSTTLDTRPESVFEVYSWVEEHVTDTDRGEEEETVDLPEEQLQDLGYI